MMKISNRRKVIQLSLGIILVLLTSIVAAQETTPRPPLFEIESATASAVAWSSDGIVLAVGDSMGVQLYTEDLQPIRMFEQPSEQMKALDWSPDGKYIVAVGANDIAPIEKGDLENPNVYVWEAETGALVTVFDEHGFLIPTLAWSPDGDWIASGSWDNTVQVWDPLTGEVYRVFSTLSEEGFAQEVMSIAWSTDSNQLAAVALDAGIFIWNVDTNSLAQFIPNQHPYPPIPIVVAWDSDGDTLATGYGTIDLKTLTETNFENCPPSGSVHWHPDSQVLALLGDTSVTICDVVADQVLSVLEGGVGTIEALVAYDYSLDWNPDGQRLAGAAGDGFIRVWQVFDDWDDRTLIPG